MEVGELLILFSVLASTAVVISCYCYCCCCCRYCCCCHCCWCCCYYCCCLCCSISFLPLVVLLLSLLLVAVVIVLLEASAAVPFFFLLAIKDRKALSSLFGNKCSIYAFYLLPLQIKRDLKSLGRLRNLHAIKFPSRPVPIFFIVCIFLFQEFYTAFLCRTLTATATKEISTSNGTSATFPLTILRPRYVGNINNCSVFKVVVAFGGGGHLNLISTMPRFYYV